MKTKQFYFGMLMALVAMTFTACSSDNELEDKHGAELQFAGGFNSLVAPQEIDPWGTALQQDSMDATLSKVSKFKVDEEEVKTRAPQDNTWANMSDRNLSVKVGNSVYKYSVAANGAITSGTPYYFTTTSNVSVSAWYPYTASLNSFSVQANQSTAANYEKSCLLYATQTVRHDGVANSLTFSHKTAKLVITVQFKGMKYILDSRISSLKIDGAKITGTVSNGSITGTSGNATQMTAYCSRASSTSNDIATATFECSIIPQTATLKLSIKEDSLTYTGTISSRTYAANTIYTATVVMDATPKLIDMGLPSGVKWSDRNIGARKPGLCGAYFAWGETSPKTVFTTANHTYNATSDISPTSGHDAARVNWGGTWRMPTAVECKELDSLCTVETVTIGTQVCRKYTARNGNSILIPACGEYNVNHDEPYPTSVNLFGDYWTSSYSSRLGANGSSRQARFGGIEGVSLVKPSLSYLNDGNGGDGDNIRPVSN